VSQAALVETTNNPAEAGTARVIYILYLVGLVVGITALVGVIMAYVNRGSAPAWVESHYQFQIRTFWIGLLYFLVSFVTSFVVVGLLLGALSLVWMIVRCVKGLQAASAGAPYANPRSWLW
jgi:uncharacterized membrane protein